MSKGHGSIQRHVLRELGEAAAKTHVRDWVAVVEMGWSSRAEKQAVRRAMKRLAEEGYVELFYRPLRDVEYGGRVRSTFAAGSPTRGSTPWPGLRRARGSGDGPMIILLVLVLLGLLFVAGFIAFEVVGEKRDETW